MNADNFIVKYCATSSPPAYQIPPCIINIARLLNYQEVQLFLYHEVTSAFWLPFGNFTLIMLRILESFSNASSADDVCKEWCGGDSLQISSAEEAFEKHPKIWSIIKEKFSKRNFNKKEIQNH